MKIGIIFVAATVMQCIIVHSLARAETTTTPTVTTATASPTPAAQTAAPTPNAKPTTHTNDVTWDSFMCKSIRDAKLTQLKEELLENCDLNRPFSFTEGGSLGGAAKTTFCCHKKD